MHLSILRLKTILLVVDLAVAAASLLLASALRFGPEWLTVWHQHFRYPATHLSMYALVWVLVLAACGIYRPGRLWSLKQEMALVARAVLLFALVILAFLTALKIYDVSRLLLLLAFLLQAGLTMLSRVTIRSALGRWRAAGANQRHVLIIGAGERGREFARELARNPELGIRVIGFLDDDPEKKDHEYAGVPILGGLSDLPEILTEWVVDEVVVALPFDAFDRIRQVVAACEAQGKNVHLMADTLETRVARSRLTELNGLPLLSLVSGPDAPVALTLKRVIDVVGAAALLVLASPVMLAVAVAVKLTSPGPVLFRQQRVGLNGRLFTLYKFRSMVADAEARLAEVCHLNEMSGPVFKVQNDPRITPVGRWLRRTSLDELPQLWNVVKGDMSLVGPRPPLPNEVRIYNGDYRRRLSMRPGLTCLWQVNGRNDIADFDDWVQLDLEYINRWNLWMDAKILARTVPEVLGMRGR